MQWRHTVWSEAELVYTSIPKVANTSIKTALMSTYGPPGKRLHAIHDADMPFVQVPRNRIRIDHPTYVHFGASRNPFDRLVSFWADKIDGPQPLNHRQTRLGFTKEMSFAEAARLAASIPDSHADGHFRSQSFLLADRNGQLLPDLLLRFERMNEDWDLLCSLVAARTGSTVKPLPKRRVSQHRHFSEYYRDDPDLVEIVLQRYALDFKLLSYPRDPVAAHAAESDVQTIAPAVRKAVTNLDSPKVLDLGQPTKELIALVDAAGGRYLGQAKGSALGHLMTVPMLTDGRIEESMFDVLLVRDLESQRGSVHRDLVQRFRSSGRAVVLLPGSARPEMMGPLVSSVGPRHRGFFARAAKSARRRLLRLKSLVRR